MCRDGDELRSVGPCLSGSPTHDGCGLHKYNKDIWEKLLAIITCLREVHMDTYTIRMCKAERHPLDRQKLEKQVVNRWLDNLRFNG